MERTVGKQKIYMDDDSPPAYWLLIMFIRPLWQLAVVVAYAAVAHSVSMEAVEAMGAATFSASNLVLITKISHPRWSSVQRYALYIEASVAGALSVIFLLHASDGPAVLLMLPSVITFVVRFLPNRAEVWLMTANLAVYGLALVLNLGENSRSFADPWTRWMLFYAYGAVLVFGMTIAKLIAHQRMEREHFRLAKERMEAQSQQLERINVQLNDYANRVYDLAAVEERNRIAGEIHDTVAHRLTALFVQLQAARRILSTGDVQTTEGNLTVCEELAREALDEVRTSVRAIRRTSSDEGMQSLRRLSIQFASLTGMDIQFEAESGLSTLPTPMMATLYRVIQEGLTNAQRHGRATQVWIRLKRKSGFLLLEVEDNGRGQASPQFGFGLSSMRDRIHQYGGELQVSSQPAQGFTLQLRMPLWEVSSL